MPSIEMATALAVMLLVRIGQTLLLAGSVRSKNAAGTAVRLLLDLAIATLTLWAVGGLLLRSVGDEPIYRHAFGLLPRVWADAMWMLPAILVATGAVLGTVAERTRVAPLLVLSALIAGVVIPGLMRITLEMQTRWPIHDTGLGLAVLIGGTAALVGAILVRARKGKFNRDLSVNFVPGHNVVFQLVGLLILTIGWAAAARGVMNVMLSLSAASLAGAAFGRFRFGKIDTGLTIAGAIAGLCAVAAGAATLPGYGAVLAGLLAGIIAPWVLMKFETRWRLDDVAGSASTHLVGGIIGWLFAPLLSVLPANERSHSLLGHVIVLGLAIVVTAIVAGLTLIAFRAAGGLRVTEDAEFDGTDLAELDVNAYPDFQQTMIKSYHLREL